MDKETADIWKSIVADAASQTADGLIEIAITLPVVAPVAMLIKQLVSICKSAKCNKAAFQSLRERLDFYSNILLKDLLPKINPEDNDQFFYLQHAVDNMEKIMASASTELVKFTKLGFLNSLLFGLKPKETFDEFDANLTTALQELAVSLQVQSIQFHKQSYAVICNVQNIVESQLGGLNAVLENQASLQTLASTLQTDVILMRAEVSSTLQNMAHNIREIKEDNVAALNQMHNILQYVQKIDNLLTVRQTQETKKKLLDEIPSLEAGQCVWTAQSKVLGQGGFGKVYLGFYKGEEVAVKTIKNCSNEPDIVALITEVCIHNKVSALPGVIRLYGADLTSLDVEKRCIVMELAHGSLYDVLYNTSSVDVQIDMSLPSKIHLMLQVAQTMVYLHELKILHRDIKPANILLIRYFDHVKAKLCDFGLAKSFEIHGQSTMRQGTIGTHIYTAPELRENKYSAESDVFAYSITLNEVLSEELPVVDVNSGLRLFISTDAATDINLIALLKVVQSGLHSKASSRKPFAWIVAELNSIYSSFNRLRVAAVQSNTTIHSRGIKVYANGDEYNGDFKGEEKHGKGVMKCVNGDVYDGDWYNDCMHGYGSIKYHFKDNYKGQWQNDNMHGLGLMEYRNGDVYDGEWMNDEQHGKGVKTSKNGDVYDGEWLNGKKHGRGVKTYNDGHVYVGEWLIDEKHGNGVEVKNGKRKSRRHIYGERI